MAYNRHIVTESDKKMKFLKITGMAQEEIDSLLPIPRDQYETVMATVEKYLALANLYGYDHGKEDLETPFIDFTLRGTTGGTAHSGKNMINLNKILLLENFDLYQVRTIPHEIAHIVVDKFFGYQRQSHGKCWKFVMKSLFGLEPSRCHSMDTTNSMVRNTKQFEYACDCEASFYMGAFRHNKMLKGYVVYRCGKCQGVVRFLGNQTDKRTLMAENKMK